MPFINSDRLDGACNGIDDCGPVPYNLISGIMAYCTVYFPQLRPKLVTLWSLVINALDDDYRQPRLRTIQTALCLFIARPAENSGQNEIQLMRVSCRLPCLRVGFFWGSSKLMCRR